MLKDILEEIKNKTIKIHNKNFIFNFNKTEEEWQEKIKDRVRLSENDFLDLIERGLNSIPNERYNKNENCVIFYKSRFILLIHYTKNLIITIRDIDWDKPISNNQNNCERIFVRIKESRIKENEFILNENLDDFMNYYIEKYNNHADNEFENMLFEGKEWKPINEIKCNCIEINY